MEKEPWVFKGGGQNVSLTNFINAYKEVQPKLKEDWDNFMNEEVPAFNKLFQSSRQ